MRTLPPTRILLVLLATACTDSWSGLGGGSVARPLTEASGTETAPQQTTIPGSTTTPPGAVHTGDTGAAGARWQPVARGSSLPDLSGYPPLLEGGVQNSGFGPRLLGSDGGRSDFHLGIDWEASLGTSVYAIADGTVHDLDYDGAHTLFIEHLLDEPVTFHGVAVDRFFVMYSHLDEILVSEDEEVRAGQRVATVGDSGDVLEPHLHAEIRLGAWCSLRHALENPDSDCGLGFDPAINPARLVGGSVPGGLEAQVLSEDPLSVRVRTPESDLDWNRLETDHGVLDFDLREGLDATTIEGLDDLDYGWVRVDPEPSAAAPGYRAWTLTFTDRPTFVEVLDWRGEGVRLELP